MKNQRFKRVIYFVSVIFLLLQIISCEEDFTDIRTNIVGNNDFTTNDTVFSAAISTKDIESVRADALAIGGVLGQYLLGVYNNQNYEKIEASIITQLDIPFSLFLNNEVFGADTTVVTTIDTAFIKLPYQATFLGQSGAGPLFNLDSIIGDKTQPFTLNVYRLSSFLNTLNPTNPALQNSFQSNHVYETFTEKLNFFEDFQLIPRNQDTVQFVIRRLANNQIYSTDSISLPNSNPFLAIPLKKNIIKQEFLDKYNDPEFQSQEAFNNFFRGLLIEATGNNGSLISFSFNTNAIELIPSLEIYYTNTVYRSNGAVIIDTIKKNDSFQFTGVRNNKFVMTPGNALASHQAKVQGTAGSSLKVDLFGADTNLNGFPDELDYLRSQNWLINDARLTVYVDKATVGSDTTATPFRMFLFKDGVTSTNQPNQSQILDAITEGINAIDGNLRIGSDRKPDRYVFNLTDYISELAAGRIDYLPSLGIKALNPTDLPTTINDTIIRTYSWNPKAVMLLNEMQINGSRKPELKISYSKKINEN